MKPIFEPRTFHKPKRTALQFSRTQHLNKNEEDMPNSLDYDLCGLYPHRMCRHALHLLAHYPSSCMACSFFSACSLFLYLSCLIFSFPFSVFLAMLLFLSWVSKFKHAEKFAWKMKSSWAETMSSRCVLSQNKHPFLVCLRTKDWGVFNHNLCSGLKNVWP